MKKHPSIHDFFDPMNKVFYLSLQEKLEVLKTCPLVSEDARNKANDLLIEVNDILDKWEKLEKIIYKK